ncbi:MAG TPA: SCO family protein [Gemmatimonadales bacterium]|nr:SCO family protein [Gemmatimonadales bacterium]
MRRLLPLMLVAAACKGAPAKAPDPSTNPYKGLELMQAVKKPDFTLTDLDGKPFHFRQETDGYLTLLFFGYTNCPDVCPLHMANIGAVMRQQPPEIANRVKVVFVTTDPERDSMAVLKAWLGRFDPQFIGLTGTHAEIVAAQEAANQLPATKDTAAADRLANGGYSVGHSALVLAYTADDSLRVVYPFGIRQEDWAYDIPRLAQVGFPR